MSYNEQKLKRKNTHNAVTRPLVPAAETTEEVKEPPKKSGGFFASLKNNYYNITYSMKSNSKEELARILAFDSKAKPLIDPKIIIFG